MSKQTAVEWLYEAILSELHMRIGQEQAHNVRGLLDQALAMEREQIMQSYSDGLGNGMHFERGDATDSVMDEHRYFETTYEKEATDANG